MKIDNKERLNCKFKETRQKIQYRILIKELRLKIKMKMEKVKEV